MDDETLTQLLQTALAPEPGLAARMHAEWAAARDAALVRRNVLAALARSQDVVAQIRTHSNPTRWAARCAA